MPRKSQKDQQQGARPLQDQDEEKRQYEAAEDLVDQDEARQLDQARTAAD